jgi:hypothetical protein
MWLDDERPAPREWTWVKTLAEAKEFAADGDVDCMSLDHDLGWCQACESAADGAVTGCTCETGYHFVMWLAETGLWPAQKPIVHSMNPAGRANMIAAVDRYFGTKAGEPRVVPEVCR